MPTTNLDVDTLSMAADPSNGHHAQNFVVDATTQTDEFDYINCNSKPKPRDKDYFENDDKTRFYTGLPSFEIPEKTLGFVAPFCRPSIHHTGYISGNYFSADEIEN